MLRTIPTAAVRIALLGAIAAVCPAGAQEEAAPAGSLWELSVPGGLRGALQAVGDPAAADRSQFLLEFIRRVHGGTALPDQAGAAQQQRLLGYLEGASAARGDTAASGVDSLDTLPLGLPPSVWRRVVAGDASPHVLLTAILQSRNASLLYYGVLSLDENTRLWLAGQPELVADLASRHAASFVLAAPSLRVSGGAMRVPGGAAAEPSWEALAGARTGQPAAFVRALLARNDGRLAYLFGAMAPLTERQIRFVLQLDAPGAGDRLTAAERLLAVFERITPSWDIEQKTFWRPAMDPALLAVDLRLDGSGVPVLPGTRRFWSLVFGGAAPGDTVLDAAVAEGPAAEFAWVCDQVFGGGDVGWWSRRYRAVLFASRLNLRLSPRNARDSVVAVRSAWEYPALAATLERGRVHEPSVIAQAARRAAQLSAIGHESRAVGAITQFQGALAILARAASRRSVPPDRFADLVSSLSAIDPDQRGDYEGALVRWLDTNFSGAAGQLDQDLLRLVAGAAPAEPRFVVWEGTRYRVDIAHAEAIRVSRLLGEDARPYASSAVRLVRMADALGRAALTVGEVRDHLGELAALGPSVGWDAGGDWAGDAAERFDAVAKALAQAARAKDISGVRQLTRPLLVLADDLLARGLLELTYATALGQPERAWVTAADVAKRHTFHIRPPLGRTDAWELPAVMTGLRAGFAVGGSLLGLDTALAELALVRLSAKPPLRKPTLSDVNRKGFVAAVTLVEPAWLADDDLERIVAAIRKGRTRVSALQNARDALALAEDLRLSPSRGSLLSWMVAHEPARVSSFLSPGELLMGGIGDVPDDSALHAWGAPALSRVGCLCLRLPRREPGEVVAGRWGSGIFVSTFPDLNLRLAELLAEMQMPASLLGPVLASATLDFVNTAVSRDEDDRRGLTEFVQALDRTRLEQYLALLTTDGPLVPVDETADQAITRARP